jgi:DNA-binding GntR family transcriptional regulator
MTAQPAPAPTAPAPADDVLLWSERDSQAERAYRLLETMIVMAQLEPSAATSELQLSRLTGIGRMPVREALRRLAEYGLVRVLPQRGVMVSPLDTGAYLLMLETRAALDRLLAQSAARRATQTERLRLHGIAEGIVAAAARDHLDRFLDLDDECDRLVADAARNPHAVRAAAPFHVHGRRFWTLHRRPGDLKHSAALHGKLALAVAGGNEAEAALASDKLHAYLRDVARRVAMG